MSLQTFKMLVGLPASGKSNISKSYKDRGYKIHSSDELRKELYGSREVQDKNNKLFEELHKRIKRDLYNGYDVVYDATNIKRKRRMAFLREIKKYECDKEAVFLATSYEECLKRNNIRENPVPEYVIKRMYMDFDIPYKFEGWNTINIIFDDKQIGVNIDINEIYNGDNGLNKLEHDNPHHSLTVGRHMFETAKHLLNDYGYDDLGLYQAALFHDIGKGFTKTFTNAKGEPTDIAHYYQHHLVGAYMMALILLKSKYEQDDILDTCQLISFHMLPHMVKKEKTIQKYKNMLGEEFYNRLMILHESDVKAH